MSRRLELRRLLEGYDPAADESQAYAQMAVLSAAPSDVLSRYHFDPGHFTASGFVVTPDRARLLLVHHERLGRWLQPGGHIEAEDATLLAAARREVTEETGLSVLPLAVEGVFDLDVHHIPAARGEPGHEHHDVRFLFEGEGPVVAGDGVAESRWVLLEEIESLTTDESVRRAVRKLLASQ